MSVVCCPGSECGSAMEPGEDEHGIFWYCESCGMDWDDADVDTPESGVSGAVGSEDA